MKTRSASLVIAAATKKAVKKKIAKKSTSSSLNAAAASKKSMRTNSSPWFSIFTKGDMEYNEYMTTEWGFEKRGDEALFEKVCLEGAQSGLSWLTVLRKRNAYRRVFHDFDIDKVAAMTPADVDRILQEEDENTRNIIVRHRGKVESTINNAKCIQQMRIDDAEKHKESPHGIFDDFLWSFVDSKPILNVSWKGGLRDAATMSPESKAMSKALKKNGFRFVGPTTCYAMMQSVGMVLDHPTDSIEWKAAHDRLQSRPGGYQER